MRFKQAKSGEGMLAVSFRNFSKLLHRPQLTTNSAESLRQIILKLTLNVEDYYPQTKRWWLRLREKNGKVNQMPCHHKLEAYLDAYLDAAGIRDDRKGPLFRAAIGRTGQLASRPLSRTDVWYMIRRRAADAKLETAIGCHTFRAIGITDYLTNGGKLEVAQRMAGHANAKTTGLYDRRNDDISLSEIERIAI